MAKRKGLIAAAMAFASTPAGRRVIQQAKNYASRPENRERARAFVQQAREYAARPENRERVQKVINRRSRST